MADRCLYFGCWNEAGHYMFVPGGRWPDRELGYRPFEYYGAGAARHHVDGTLAPRIPRPRSRTWHDVRKNVVWSGMGRTSEESNRITWDSEECPQGQFLLHHLDTGFTAIQWWDRTQGDGRGACNGTILLEGRHTSEEMLAALAEHFPHVLANLRRAGVELVEVTVVDAV